MALAEEDLPNNGGKINLFSRCKVTAFDWYQTCVCQTS